MGAMARSSRQSWRWKLQRLRAMSLAELPWRLSCAWRDWRGQFRNWPTAAQIAATNSKIREQTPLVAKFPPLPSAAQIAACPGEWRDAEVAAAEEILSTGADIFGRRVPLQPSPSWNQCPATLTDIPTHFAPRLNYRNLQGVDDVKHVWELGRMQFLLPLARAWRLSGRAEFAREAMRLMLSWIEQCPPMRGIHWSSPMEASLRLISWTWTRQLLGHDAPLANADLAILQASVAQHLEFIHHRYSRFSSANNHLTAEAAGAYFAAAYWRALPAADQVRRRARKHLLWCAKEQNYSDGVNKEQAFAYQFFVWDLLLLAALAGEDCGEPFPRDYWNALRGMASFLTAVSDCRGNTPHVGDEDGGSAWGDGDLRSRPARRLRTVAARLWKRDACFAEPALAEAVSAAWWLIGPESKATERFAADTALPQASMSPALARPPSQSSAVFDAGGYVVFRHGQGPREAMALFDAGPLGWPETAVHGHADALAVWLHLGGQPVLVDAGTFNYADHYWRKYFRGTRQHNTLAFGENDQAEYLNRFMWGRRPKVRLVETHLTDNRCHAAGEVRWWNGPWHARRIVWRPLEQALEIVDEFNGKRPQLRFHLSPRLQVQLSDPYVCQVRGKFGCLTVTNLCHPLRIEEIPISDSFYEREQSNCIVINLNGGESTTGLAWEFAASDEKRTEPPS